MSKHKGNESDRRVKAQRDNRSNQLNPNNPAYWLSRGYVMKEVGDDFDD